jgi:hypothetical protein
MPVFQRATQRLLNSAAPPRTLWVVHTPLTLAMCKPLPGTHLDMQDHADWLLALESETLALFKIRGPRLTKEDLRFRTSLVDSRFEFRDIGDLSRRRVFSIADANGAWVAVSAPLHRTKSSPTAAFTDEILARRNT